MSSDGSEIYPGAALVYTREPFLGGAPYGGTGYYYDKVAGNSKAQDYNAEAGKGPGGGGGGGGGRSDSYGSSASGSSGVIYLKCS